MIILLRIINYYLRFHSIYRVIVPTSSMPVNILNPQIPTSYKKKKRNVRSFPQNFINILKL